MRNFHHSQGVLKGSCNACRKTSTIQPLCQVRFAPIPLAALRNKMELKATEADLQTSITWWVACFWKPQINLFQSRNESNSSVLIFSANEKTCNANLDSCFSKRNKDILKTCFKKKTWGRKKIWGDIVGSLFNLYLVQKSWSGGPGLKLKVSKDQLPRSQLFPLCAYDLKKKLLKPVRLCKGYPPEV